MTTQPQSAPQRLQPGLTSRLASLDALRCGAVLLGIVLHTAVAYMPSRMPGLVWPVHNERTDVLFDFVFWGIHAFRIPLFFLLAGFFAEFQYDERGVRNFIAHRRRRIAFPYYLGIATVLPLTLVVWNLGWYLTGRCTVEQIFSPFVKYEPELQDHYFGSGHLWFLADLFLLNVAYGVIRREWGGQESSSGQSSRRMCEDQPSVQPSAWLPVKLAGLSAWTLWGSVGVVISHNNSFIPNIARCAYYGLYFVVGAAAFRRREQLFDFTKYYRWNLLLAVPALACFLLSVPREATGHGMWLSRLGLSLSATMTAWMMIFGLLGWSLRNMTAERVWIRYLSDASYWLYLSHLPVVGLIHVALHASDWSPIAKFGVVSFLTTTIGLASYHTCVRYTRLGEMLHGARRRSTQSETLPFPATAVESFAMKQDHDAARTTSRSRAA